jgi:hypothetical protein
MKTLLIILALSSICFGQIRGTSIDSIYMQGDTLVVLKYRERFVTDTGAVYRTVKMRWRGNSISQRPIVYKRVRIITESEVEE